MPHPIVHVEFSANDSSAAGRFYSEIFGWKLEEAKFDSGDTYTMFDAAPGPGGGFNTVDGQNHKAGDVIVYIATDDIAATLARVEALGGKTVMPKTEIPGQGWMALFADPTGNRVGLYTPLQAPAQGG